MHEVTDRPHKVTGDCVTRTFNATMTGAAAGTFFGACQLAWYPDSVQNTTRFSARNVSDSRAIMRTMARPAFWMSAAAGAFAVAECTAEAARGKSDSWNAAIGGMAAGTVMGAISKSGGIMVSSALGMGLFMFALDMSSPSTVFEGNQEELKHKMHGVLPKTHQESTALSSLKEKYPQFKNI